jgi:hypothetical protein
MFQSVDSKGGTALSIISTGGENLVVNVNSSARIYGGGGGGEKGKQGDQGASGLCQDFVTERDCGTCPDVPRRMDINNWMLFRSWMCKTKTL